MSNQRISDQRLIELWNRMCDDESSFWDVDTHDCVYPMDQFDQLFKYKSPLTIASMVGRKFNQNDCYFTWSTVYNGYISFSNIFEVIDITVLYRHYNTQDLNSIG